MAGGDRYVPPYRVGYVDARAMADAWGWPIRRVQRACAAGRVPGAIRVPNPSAGPTREAWLIPFDAVRPSERR